jgi:hypothetical protein
VNSDVLHAAITLFAGLTVTLFAYRLGDGNKHKRLLCIFGPIVVLVATAQLLRALFAYYS